MTFYHTEHPTNTMPYANPAGYLQISRADAPAFRSLSNIPLLASRQRLQQHLPQWRLMSTTTNSRQAVAPTMQQLRVPFSRRNKSTLWVVWQPTLHLILIFSRYYTLSVILGTVALSYGSVPMYKMVCVLCYRFRECG